MGADGALGPVRALEAAVAGLTGPASLRLAVGAAAAAVVPAWADLCVITLRCDDLMAAVGTREVALSLSAGLASDAEPVRQLLDGGRPRLFVDALGADPEVRSMTRELGLGSTLLAPIRSGDCVLGGLLLAQTSGSRRGLGELDVALGSVLARSVAMVAADAEAAGPVRRPGTARLRPAGGGPSVRTDALGARRAVQRAIDAGQAIFVAAVDVMPAGDAPDALRRSDVAYRDASGAGWCAVAGRTLGEAGPRFDDVVGRLAQRARIGVAELMPGDDAAGLIARARWRLRQASGDGAAGAPPADPRLRTEP